MATRIAAPTQRRASFEREGLRRAMDSRHSTARAPFLQRA
jgi:hypothetical protein